MNGRESLRSAILVSSMLVSVSMSVPPPAWCQCFDFGPRIKVFGMPAPNDKFRGTRQLLDLTGIRLFFPVEDEVTLLV